MTLGTCHLRILSSFSLQYWAVSLEGNCFGILLFLPLKISLCGEFFTTECQQTIIYGKRVVTVSMCSLCDDHYEIIHHLFLEGRFANQLWDWLGDVLNYPLDKSSIPNLLTICSKYWSQQIHDLILATAINILDYLALQEQAQIW